MRSLLSVVFIIIRYFKEILLTLSSSEFYNEYIKLPKSSDPTPFLVQNNPKWYPYFEDAIGAMDGTHIACAPSATERAANRNRKGGVTQNTLACCSFDMEFQFMQSGWEGSVADFTMYHRARLVDLPIPDGKYYLADAGFGVCYSLLVPYHGVQYHLAEWGRAGVRCVQYFQQIWCRTECIRPANREELFNLRHASARNVIERIFGALKKRFRILKLAPEYNMDMQARIPPALAAIHNFIFKHDTTEQEDFLDIPDPTPGNPPSHEDLGILSQGAPNTAEKTRAKERRDKIAQAMWDNYQALLAEQMEEDILE